MALETGYGIAGGSVKTLLPDLGRDQSEVWPAALIGAGVFLRRLNTVKTSDASLIFSRVAVNTYATVATVMGMNVAPILVGRVA